MFSDNESNLSPAELDYIYHDDGPPLHAQQSKCLQRAATQQAASTCKK